MASPDDSLFATALAHQRAGRLAEAEKLYDLILTLDPRHADSLHMRGVIACQLGRHQSAVDLIGQAIAVRDDVAAYHTNLAVALRQLGRPEDAIPHLRRAAALAPERAGPHYDLGWTLHDQGQLEEAIAEYRRAAALDPDDARVPYSLGLALRQQGNRTAAIAAYQQALTLAPDDPQTHFSLGVALHEEGRLAEAAAAYARAVALKPDDAGAHYNLGVALHGLGDADAAVAQFERALALRPAYGAAHGRLGDILQEQGRIAEALARYERALALLPDNADLHANVGNTHWIQGDIPAAQRAYQRAIQLAPRRGRFHASLLSLARITPGDPALAALEELARDMASFPVAEQVQFRFALGKAYSDLEQPDRAFGHLAAGNALKRGLLTYDEGETLGYLARVRATFTQELVRSERAVGDPSTVPVFIIGMPRSGTTLVEQILASHPLVFGGGERRELPHAVRDLRARNMPLAFPEIVPLLTNRQLGNFARRYLDALTALAPDATRITDKMPSNYGHVGLIHLAFPLARIIHVRRDPIDTCLSCFATLFAEDHPYSYDLGELGRYYRAYAGLMAHWRDVLPDGVMHEVAYEALVDDFEAEARRLVAHCGLEWDAACLAFHRTRRPVHTASGVQVRRPLYRESIGRWRAYQAYLGPLIEALGEDAA